jgi:hypothetical protein
MIKVKWNKIFHGLPTQVQYKILGEVMLFDKHISNKIAKEAIA